MDQSSFAAVYGEEARRLIDEHVRFAHPVMEARDAVARLDDLKDTQVLFSGWGCPLLDETWLNAMPRLEAVFYAAGSLSGVVTPGIWERGITISSAVAANAIPVAEYTLSVILFSLRHGWRQADATRAARDFVDRDSAPGSYGARVGLISLGTIARTLLTMLRPFDLHVSVCDPFLTDDEASTLGIRKASLEEVFESSDVVSLHSPLLSETRNMIEGRHFEAMKPGATFVNTARGEIVRESEMIDVATRRSDLQFVLDVTAPEPPEKDSPLYVLPNVLLTPHIAGSIGNERARLGRYMAEELQRYVAGDPLRWVVWPEAVINSSHRPVRVSRETLQQVIKVRKHARSTGKSPDIVASL